MESILEDGMVPCFWKGGGGECERVRLSEGVQKLIEMVGYISRGNEKIERGSGEVYCPGRKGYESGKSGRIK